MYRLASLGLALTLAAASPAGATTIMTAIYTGSVSGSSFDSGVFGAEGSLVGAAFTARVTYDIDTGTRTTSATEDTVFGDPFVANDEPIQAVRLTIKGVTHLITPGSGSSSASLSDLGGGFGLVSHGILNGAGGDIDLRLVSKTDPPPYDLTASFIRDSDTVFGGDFSVHTADFTASGGLVATRVQIFAGDAEAPPPPPSDCVRCGSLAGAPEPASWGLMILGFGGAGTALRRRRWTVN